MKTKYTSRQTYLNPRNLIAFARYAASLVVAFSVMSSATAELNPSVPAQGNGRWSETGDLITARSNHAAALLPNGQVLVAGGYAATGALASAGEDPAVLASSELYNPATGMWATTGSMNVAREFHTATLLPDGQVLVVGGVTSSGVTSSTAELYRPATGMWKPTRSMGAARQWHTATLLPSGQVLVAGGFSVGVSNSAGASTELYDPATRMWTSTGSMAAVRYLHTATLLPNGQVLVAGGLGNGGTLVTAELYDPATGIWTSTGRMTVARVGHTATLLPSGQVLVTGGDDSDITTAELYDPATGIWTETGSMTNFHSGQQTATLLLSGKVLVAGGNGGVGAELYDPATGAWTVTGNLATGRGSDTATLLRNGLVLVAGGAIDGSPSAELYHPAR